MRTRASTRRRQHDNAWITFAVGAAMVIVSSIAPAWCERHPQAAIGFAMLTVLIIPGVGFLWIAAMQYRRVWWAAVALVLGNLFALGSLAPAGMRGLGFVFPMIGSLIGLLLLLVLTIPRLIRGRLRRWKLGKLERLRTERRQARNAGPAEPHQQ